MGDAPVLPTMEEASADAAEYATKYATKVETPPMNASVLVAAHASAVRQQAQQPQGDDAERAALRTLRRAIHQVNGSITYALTEVCAYLLGFGDYRTSHTPKAYNFQAYSTALQLRVQQGARRHPRDPPGTGSHHGLP